MLLMTLTEDPVSEVKGSRISLIDTLPCRISGRILISLLIMGGMPLLSMPSSTRLKRLPIISVLIFVAMPSGKVVLPVLLRNNSISPSPMIGFSTPTKEYNAYVTSL